MRCFAISLAVVLTMGAIADGQVCRPGINWIVIEPVRPWPITVAVPSAPTLQMPPAKKEPPKPPLLDESSPVLAPVSVEVLVVQPAKGPVDPSRVRVKFYNHTQQNLILAIDGKATKLGAGEVLRTTPPTEFIWKIPGSEPRRQTLSKDSLGLDIIIRP